MNRRHFLAALPLSAAFVLVSRAADKPPLSDDFITDTVRQKLAGDSTVKGAAIGVEVKNGAVTLTGKVAEEKQKKKAERLAKKVKGVTSVVNQIQIATQ
jgi:osmotically-inducible protein OsmY